MTTDDLQNTKNLLEVLKCRYIQVDNHIHDLHDYYRFYNDDTKSLSRQIVSSYEESYDKIVETISLIDELLEIVENNE
jgi:hypothetical protein